MKLKDCTECKGYGWVEGLEFRQGPNGPIEVYTREDCEVCDGAGEIKEEDNKDE